MKTYAAVAAGASAGTAIVVVANLTVAWIVGNLISGGGEGMVDPWEVFWTVLVGVVLGGIGGGWLGAVAVARRRPPADDPEDPYPPAG